MTIQQLNRQIYREIGPLVKRYMQQQHYELNKELFEAQTRLGTAFDAGDADKMIEAKNDIIEICNGRLTKDPSKRLRDVEL